MNSIRLRLAIDGNRDRKIEKNEQLKGIEGLKALDQNDDKILEGRELDQVYFEYGEDVWLQGHRSHEISDEKTITQVRLKSLSLDPPSFRLESKFRRRPRISVVG